MFTQGLSQFIAKTDYKDLPKEAVTAAKLGILDHIGVAMAGSQDPSGRMVSELVQEEKSVPEATVIGLRYKASCSLAALANGNNSHVLDYDDCLDYPDSGQAHPTTGTLPAALALGEKLHISGKDLITAYLLGVEAYGKIGLICKENWVGKKGWEWTGVLGVMGATTAVSKILKLDADHVETALGIGATLASGLIRNFGTQAGHLHGGNAARNGIVAGVLAQKGYTGRHGIIEIPNGFYNAYTGTESAPADPKVLKDNFEALGNPWNILKPGLMFKAFPCCHIGHFGADAGLQLRKKHNIDWRDIEAIEFRVPSIFGKETAPKPPPETGVEGRFSLPYILCIALIKGRLKIYDFTNEGVKNPEARELMRKVKFVAQEQERKNGVFGYQEVALKMKDGNTFSCKVEHPRGEPQNPQSAEEFAAKYQDCAETAHYDAKTANQIKDLVLDLENVKDVAEIMKWMLK